jgi:hypothetical protein
MTQVRRWVTCAGTTQVSDSDKVPGNDSGRESGTSSNKDPGKRPGKSLGKVIRPGKTVKGWVSRNLIGRRIR